MTTSPTGYPTVPPKPRGCFFYGCMACLILFGAAVICGGLLFWYVVHSVNALIAEYTDPAPVELAQDHLSAAQLTDISNRCYAFGQAVDAHAAAQLALTGPEINGLLASSTNVGVREIAKCIHIEIDGDQIKGQASLPLGKLAPNVPLLNLRDRYLNCDGAFTAELTNSQLYVHLVSAQVHGKDVPDKIMSAVTQKNWAENATQDPRTAQQISRFDTIEIQDGKLIITTKKQ